MRVEVLTFLRFVAAFIVVVFHYGKKTVLAEPRVMTAGPEMVTFFFVLSGFVLVVSHARRPAESLWRFYWARLTRIAPIYWVALVATIWMIEDDRVLSKTDMHSWLIGMHASFLQAWFPGSSIRLNIAAWSISVELFFYAVFPFLLVLARQLRVGVFAGATVAVWLMTQAVTVFTLNAKEWGSARPLAHELVHHFPLPHLPSFLFGMTAGFIFLRWRLPTTRRARWGNTVLAAAAVISTFVALTHRLAPTDWAGTYIPTGASLFAPLFFALVLFVARSTGAVAEFFSRPVFVMLGEASYAFYILQHPVQLLYARHFAPKTGFSMPLDDFLLYVVALLMVSLASAYLFEKPVRQFLLWLTRVGRSPVRGMPPGAARAATDRER